MFSHLTTDPAEKRVPSKGHLSVHVPLIKKLKILRAYVKKPATVFLFLVSFA